MAKLCQIRVTESGLYCCDVGHLRIRPDCLGLISYSNLPPTTLEYEVTPDVWAPAEPPLLEGTGTETLLKPGEYRFGIDCAALVGTQAPENPQEQIGFCYEDCKVEDWGPILSAQLDSLCEKIVAGNDPTATAEIIAQLQALCKKMLELMNNIGDLSEVCDKLEALTTQLQAVCDKLEAGFESMTDLLTEIRDLLTCEPREDLGVVNQWAALRA